MLEAGDQVEGQLRAQGQGFLFGLRRASKSQHRGHARLGLFPQAVQLHIAQNSRFDPRKREEEMRVEVGDRGGFGCLGAGSLPRQVKLGLDLREGERHSERIAEARESIDPRTARIAEAKQLRHLVIGFAGRVVERAADEGVVPRAASGPRKIQVRMPTGDDQRQCRFLSLCPRTRTPQPKNSVILSERSESKDLRFEYRRHTLRALPLLQQHRMNMPFEVVHGDQRQPLRKRQRLGIGDAHQKRACKSRPGGNGNRIKIGERDVRLCESSANHGHDGAEMFAAR